MQILFRLFNPETGAVREDRVTAGSTDGWRSEMEQRYLTDGWTVLSSNAIPPVNVRSNTKDSLDSAWWARELRTLLTAGMTVVEALETLNEQALGATRAEVHALLLSQLHQGLSLSTAMKASGSFPAVLIAGVKASERTSTLVSALDDYLQYHELLDQLKRKIVSAAIYPAIVASLGGIITVFLLVFVIPRFSQMYASLNGPMGLTTRMLISASQLLSQHLPALGLAAVGLVVATVFAWRRGWIDRAADFLMESIEPLQRQIDEFRRAKLYQSMALMIRGGYAVSESMEQCAALELGPQMRERLMQATLELSQGRRVSSALSKAGLTDAVTARLLAVGERTGNFDRVLQTIAQRHASNFATFIERTTRVVEPLMLLAVSLLVGGVVVMMYMPVFDIASSIR